MGLKSIFRTGFKSILRLIGHDVCTLDPYNAVGGGNQSEKEEERENRKREESQEENELPVHLVAEVVDCNFPDSDKTLSALLQMVHAIPEPSLERRVSCNPESNSGPLVMSPRRRRKRKKTEADEDNVVEVKKKMKPRKKKQKLDQSSWIEDNREAPKNGAANEPVPSMEEIPRLVKAVQECKGRPDQAMFLYEKVLGESDFGRLNRLHFTKDKRWRLQRFLTREERLQIVETRDLKVTGVDGKKKRMFNLQLGFWKSAKQMVIKAEWNELLNSNIEIARKGNIVQIWGFRTETGKPGFAVNFGQPEQEQEQVATAVAMTN